MKAKKLMALVLALVMVLSLTVVPARAAGDANPYIADLIGYYKGWQEAAETDILRTLEEMAQVDPVQAEAWTKIMDTGPTSTPRWWSTSAPSPRVCPRTTPLPSSSWASP